MFNQPAILLSLHYVPLHNVQKKHFDWTRGIPHIPVDRITALGLTLFVSLPHRSSNQLIKPNPTGARYFTLFPFMSKHLETRLAATA